MRGTDATAGWVVKAGPETGQTGEEPALETVNSAYLNAKLVLTLCMHYVR